jgi:hypothetical protein
VESDEFDADAAISESDIGVKFLRGCAASGFSGTSRKAA